MRSFALGDEDALIMALLSTGPSPGGALPVFRRGDDRLRIHCGHQLWCTQGWMPWLYAPSPMCAHDTTAGRAIRSASRNAGTTMRVPWPAGVCCWRGQGQRYDAGDQDPAPRRARRSLAVVHCRRIRHLGAGRITLRELTCHSGSIQVQALMVGERRWQPSDQRVLAAGERHLRHAFRLRRAG